MLHCQQVVNNTNSKGTLIIVPERNIYVIIGKMSSYINMLSKPTILIALLKRPIMLSSLFEPTKSKVKDFSCLLYRCLNLAVDIFVHHILTIILSFYTFCFNSLLLFVFN